MSASTSSASSLFASASAFGAPFDGLARCAVGVRGAQYLVPSSSTSIWLRFLVPHIVYTFPVLPLASSPSFSLPSFVFPASRPPPKPPLTPILFLSPPPPPLDSVVIPALSFTPVFPAFPLVPPHHSRPLVSLFLSLLSLRIQHQPTPHFLLPLFRYGSRAYTCKIIRVGCVSWARRGGGWGLEGQKAGKKKHRLRKEKEDTEAQPQTQATAVDSRARGLWSPPPSLDVFLLPLRPRFLLALTLILSGLAPSLTCPLFCPPPAPALLVFILSPSSPAPRYPRPDRSMHTVYRVAKGGAFVAFVAPPSCWMWVHPRRKKEEEMERICVFSEGVVGSVLLLIPLCSTLIVLHLRLPVHVFHHHLTSWTLVVVVIVDAAASIYLIYAHTPHGRRRAGGAVRVLGEGGVVGHYVRVSSCSYELGSCNPVQGVSSSSMPRLSCLLADLVDDGREGGGTGGGRRCCCCCFDPIDGGREGIRIRIDGGDTAPCAC
ncbi:hypothetical protein R3P38DRAFT_3167490 [Favolaschia claudopus]|uniref:Uncharacterized protein n=1 Tax=Favolaschia claudopus TaxID=2862362 RepID=A0AAW0EE44_9AGAR